MASMDRIAGDFLSFSNDLAHLNEQAAHDVSLIEDDDWRRKVSIVLELMMVNA